MARAPRRTWLLTAAALCALPALARADDVWTTVAPGIQHLHRTTADPQDYHVVLVDLTRPEIYLRATGPGENGQLTSSYAASVGALVAINGDLWDANNWNAYEPLGLAVGDSWKWRDDTDSWSFLACDPSKQCSYDPWGHLAPTSPRWWTAIGGMQDWLVIDGVPQAYAPDPYQQRNPRTATGLTQDGKTLILLSVDGRSSVALGMNFAELTAVMMEFGAWNSINHDGGGSTTLVIGGSVQNVPSDGAERVVANHLGVLISDHTDATCVGVENSKQCVDATQFRTCIGGIDRGLSDCGAFGLTCETEGLFAYCVDPRCVNGGQVSFCLDATRIAMCEDGVYSEGDCAGFGLPCVEGLGTAWCWADFHQGVPAASSLGAPEGGQLALDAGATAEVWFELANTGLTTWTPSVTKLAPVPRDTDCPLAGPDWLTPQRAATVTAEVPPGSTGRFTFSLVAPDSGSHDVAFGLLDEGITWFADPPAGGGPVDGALAVTVQVNGSSADAGGDAGPSSGPGTGAGITDGDGDACGCTLPGRPRSALGGSALLMGLLVLSRHRIRGRCGRFRPKPHRWERDGSSGA
jgi:hypothetical protein